MPIRPKTLRPSWVKESSRKPFDRPRTLEEKDIYKNVYSTARWRKLRDLVRQREPICRLCGKEPTHTIDHIVPIRQGGDAWDMSNLQGLCKLCNFKKTINQGK